MKNEKAELSKKNPYWISKHRYYELKHFCLQYNEWEHFYNKLDQMTTNSSSVVFVGARNFEKKSRLEKLAILKAGYLTRMELVDNVAKELDPVLGDYVKEGVTKGYSYDTLKARLNIPCGRDAYYNLYRKFFWLLSMERQ